MYITLSSVSVPIYSVFFLMIPPPPRSTLFPYTTLFRSLDQIVVVLAGQPGHQQSAGEAQLMTGLTNGHPGGPRRGGGGGRGGASWPSLFREKGRGRPPFRLVEGFRRPCHELVGALSALEVMDLLCEK